MKQILTLIFLLCLIAKTNAQHIHCSEEHAKKATHFIFKVLKKIHCAVVGVITNNPISELKIT
jgi:hypothetical protein